MLDKGVLVSVRRWGAVQTPEKMAQGSFLEAGSRSPTSDRYNLQPGAGLPRRQQFVRLHLPKRVDIFIPSMRVAF